MNIATINSLGKSTIVDPIIDYVINNDIDILCVQECNTTNIDLFVFGFKRNNIHVEKCGSMIIVINFENVKILEKGFIPFTYTSQNNGIAFFQTRINNDIINIFTTKMDTGGENIVNRKKQYIELYTNFAKCTLQDQKENKDFKGSIFIGDTGFPQWQPLPPITFIGVKWIDPFYTVGTSRHEYTFNSERPDKCFYSISNYDCVNLVTDVIDNHEKKILVAMFENI